jgi:hypothetical protein
MRRWPHLVRAGGLAAALALLSNFAVLHVSFASPAPALPQPISAGQRVSVEVGDDGVLTLQSTAPLAPEAYGSFDHFGFAISSAQQFNAPFRSIRIDYQATVPTGAAVRLDVRASADGARWTAWEVDLASGTSATFASASRFAQYRATLLGNKNSRPSIGPVRLTPAGGPATYSALLDMPPMAPTWRLHATREGLVGRHTANGHRITKRDRFVSLPSWRSLSPEGTTDYMVRISYNGRSSVAPVYDVGPWNVHDNYWDEKRERFGDLERGWPEDHAAFYDRYNGGMAEKGKVRFPTAIDVGDGVWWDDLGIRGDQAVVEVTFLWLGTDPLAPPPELAIAAAPAVPPSPEPPAAPAAEPPAAPPEPAQPAPPASEPAPPPPEPAPPPPEPLPAPAPPPPAPIQVVVDARDPAFKGRAAVTWYDRPEGCGDASTSLWTYTTANPAESENVARWQPALSAEALYDVYVAIPGCAARKPNTSSARYLVQHRDGVQEVVVNQAAAAGTWVRLGRFPFRSGDGGFVELRDVAGDSMRTLWYDAVKWVPEH